MSIDRRGAILTAAAFGFAPMMAFAQATAAPFYIEDGKLKSRVLVGGVSMTAVLDTGAPFHVIDRTVASGIGLLSSGQTAELEGQGGKVRGTFSNLIELTIGGRVVGASRFAIVDLSSSALDLGTPYEVIIGLPLFMTLAADFDFVRRTFVMAEPSTAPIDRSIVTLNVTEQWRTAPVDIGGKIIQATVDIGSDAPLVLSPSTARELRILRNDNITTAPAGGIGGVTTRRMTSTPSVVFAGRAFEDVPVQIAARELGTEGNIGLGLLSRFDLWLDLRARRLLVRPNGVSGPFARNLVGFYGVPDNDALKVTHVSRDSPASEAGLSNGDRITHIDGQPAVTANRALVGAAEGRVLNLTLANGRTRALTLKRYY